MPKDSVCIINSYYDINENMAKKKSHKPETFDDVLVYYGEVNKFMHGNLTKMWCNKNTTKLHEIENSSKSKCIMNCSKDNARLIHW